MSGLNGVIAGIFVASLLLGGLFAAGNQHQPNPSPGPRLARQRPLPNSLQIRPPVCLAISPLMVAETWTPIEEGPGRGRENPLDNGTYSPHGALDASRSSFTFASLRVNSFGQLRVSGSHFPSASSG